MKRSEYPHQVNTMRPCGIGIGRSSSGRLRKRPTSGGGRSVWAILRDRISSYETVKAIFEHVQKIAIAVGLVAGGGWVLGQETPKLHYNVVLYGTVLIVIGVLLLLLILWSDFRRLKADWDGWGVPIIVFAIDWNLLWPPLFVLATKSSA